MNKLKKNISKKKEKILLSKFWVLKIARKPTQASRRYSSDQTRATYFRRANNSASLFKFSFEHGKGQKNFKILNIQK